MDRRSRKAKKSKVGSFFKGVGFVILIFIAVYVSRLYRGVSNTLEDVQKEITIEPKRQEQVQIEDADPINVLLLGTDSDNLSRNTNEGYTSRSDTMIVVTLNPKKETTQLLSIPRDSLVHIEGISYPDKINHAFAYGGEELSVDTVQEFLHVPIDYYVTINMEGLESLVDALGGIEVVSPLTFEFDGFKYIEGQKQKLNGKQALGFARMRYEDPKGDVGRQDRQRMVIKAMIDKALNLSSVLNYPDLLNVASKHIRTNLDLSKAKLYYDKYKASFNNITTSSFENIENTMIGGIFYFYVSPNERARVGNSIRSLLELDALDVTAFVDVLDGSGLTPAKEEEIIRGQENTQTFREEVPQTVAPQVQETIEAPAEESPVEEVPQEDSVEEVIEELPEEGQE